MKKMVFSIGVFICMPVSLVYSMEKTPDFESLKKQLFQAVEGGDVDKVAELLKRNEKTIGDLLKATIVGQTPLHRAAEEGMVGVTKLLIEKGAEKEATDWAKQTPLHLATRWGKIVVVRLLLERGAKINVEDDEGDTPIDIAMKKEYWGISKLLFEKIDREELKKMFLEKKEKRSNDEAVFMSAVAKGKVDEVKSGLAKVGGKGKIAKGALFVAALLGHKKVVKLLLEKKPELLKIKNNSGQTPLHVVVELGNTGVVRLLLEKGAKINVEDDEGDTPIDIAMKKEYWGIAKLLFEKIDREELKKMFLEKKEKRSSDEAVFMSAVIKGIVGEVKSGLAVGVESKIAVKALFVAVLLGHEKVVKILIEKIDREELKKMLVEEKEKISNDEAVFMSAVIKGIVDEVKSGLAKVGGKGKIAVKALFVAALLGHKKVVKILIEKIDREELKKMLVEKGQTLLHAAVELEKVWIVRLLLEMGAKIEAKDEWRGQTPLHLAAEWGYVTIVRLLLDRGANVNAKDWGEQTPLQLAKQEEIINLIKSADILFLQGSLSRLKKSLETLKASLQALSGKLNILKKNLGKVSLAGS